MKILWCVDICESHPKAIKVMSSFLSSLHSREPLKVDAVSVVYPSDLSSDTTAKTRYAKLLRSRLGSARSKKWYSGEHVIFESQMPQRVAVMDLIEFARKGDYDAVAAVKHSKVGRKHSYLGSFAEMLAFLTPIPLFLVNPDGIVPKQIRLILTATDAGPNRMRDLRKLSEFLPLDGVSLTLVHQVTGALTADEMSAAARRARESLMDVQTIAHQVGATAQTEMRRDGGSIADFIIKRAKNHRDDLIVLTHKGKGLLGFLLGRTTRKVLQGADRPVLLFRI